MHDGNTWLIKCSFLKKLFEKLIINLLRSVKTRCFKFESILKKYLTKKRLHCSEKKFKKCLELWERERKKEKIVLGLFVELNYLRLQITRKVIVGSAAKELQCVQIWQIFATLAKIENFKKKIKNHFFLKKFEPTLGTIFMLWANFHCAEYIRKSCHLVTLHGKDQDCKTIFAVNLAPDFGLFKCYIDQRPIY